MKLEGGFMAKFKAGDWVERVLRAIQDLLEEMGEISTRIAEKSDADYFAPDFFIKG
jgi:hypothetical protein